ncbi:MAG: hypothetical protein JWM27_702 [Gemmatimonadetes bacterium]|nr:hypothetical protein [Gemmatimonadota bacterium]
MFVLVEHFISDPAVFWSSVEYSLAALPTFLKLHQCLPTPDGTHAVCVWEAGQMEEVSGFLEAYVGHVARNVYYPVEASVGIAMPTGLPARPDAAVA